MKMKQVVKKITGYKKEKKKIKHDDVFDEFGNLIRESYEEVVEVDVPILEDVIEEVEMTKEEILSLEMETSNNVEPTLEERLEAMESAMLDMILGGAL